jgi:hypothetical protein
MKLLFISAIFLIVALNVIGIYYVNVLFLGFYFLIGIYSIIAIQYIKLSKLILHTLCLCLISLMIKITINYAFNIQTIAPEGKIVPFWITIAAALSSTAIAGIISIILGGIILLIKKRR